MKNENEMRKRGKIAAPLMARVSRYIFILFYSLFYFIFHLFKNKIDYITSNLKLFSIEIIILNGDFILSKHTLLTPPIK